MPSGRETNSLIENLHAQLLASESEAERLSSIVAAQTRQLESQSAQFARLSADFESLRTASCDQTPDPIVTYYADDGSVYSWPLVGVGEVFVVESTEGFRRWELQVNRQAVIQSLSGREPVLAEHVRLLALLRRALSPRRSPPSNHP